MNTDTFLTLFLLKFQIPHKHVLSPSRTRDHHFQPISVLGYVRQTEVLNLTLSIPADMRITSCLCLPWNPRLNWHLNLSLPNFFASFSNGCSHLKHFPSTFPRDLWVQSLYWLGPILVTMSKAQCKQLFLRRSRFYHIFFQFKIGYNSNRLPAVLFIMVASDSSPFSKALKDTFTGCQKFFFFKYFPTLLKPQSKYQ